MWTLSKYESQYVSKASLFDATYHVVAVVVALLFSNNVIRLGTTTPPKEHFRNVDFEKWKVSNQFVRLNIFLAWAYFLEKLSNVKRASLGNGNTEKHN